MIPPLSISFMIDLSLNLFLIVAVLLVLPYVLGPIIIYLTVSMPSMYDFKEIPWDKFISERSRIFLDLHDQLLDLGFEPVGASNLASSHAKTHFSLYRHPQHTATASLLSAEAANVPESIVIDFTQRYADDLCITVNNMKDATVFPDHKRKKKYRFPGEADPANLFVKFKTIILGVARSDAVELPPGREFEYISNFVEDEMKELVSGGMARQSASDGKIRFTFIGACLGTWKMLWPWKGILKRQDLEMALLASKGS